MDNKDDLSEEDLFDFIIKIILGALLIIFLALFDFNQFIKLLNKT